MDNPSYAWNFHQVLTAHPLGGCPMAETADEGVVDSYGETFGQPGLYIVDGSVMPGPVGPNPSLTIAAFADRSADHIIAQHEGEKR
jgi:cholesterol oxidase